MQYLEEKYGSKHERNSTAKPVDSASISLPHASNTVTLTEPAGGTLLVGHEHAILSASPDLVSSLAPKDAPARLLAAIEKTSGSISPRDRHKPMKQQHVNAYMATDGIVASSSSNNVQRKSLNGPISGVVAPTQLVLAAGASCSVAEQRTSMNAQSSRRPGGADHANSPKTLLGGHHLA